MLLPRLSLLLTLLLSCGIAQAQEFKKAIKFSTFYAAVNGGNSVSDRTIYSVTDGLTQETIATPFDYSLSMGVRKIARFGYENRANAFYDGTESSYSADANIGKRNGIEFLGEVTYERQQGREFFNQHHFFRYIGDKVMAKVEYLEDGFADIEYFEGSQRFRLKLGSKFSLHAGIAQRISEPYGYDPLEEWKLATGDIHYTYLAIEEGYSHNLTTGEYLAPDGTVVATNTEVWEAVTIPNILSEYTARKRSELSRQWNYSVVAGFDFYHFTDDFWFHSWGNVLPYHYDTGGEYMYHNTVDGQWLDYSGGLIFGKRFNKHIGVFLEGRYYKYWNREWYNFKCGANYVIF